MLKKIFEDSLTNKDGKYSSKKLTTLFSFAIAVFIALTDQLTSHKLNITVFETFIIMAGGQTVLSMIANIPKNEHKTDLELK